MTETVESQSALKEQLLKIASQTTLYRIKFDELLSYNRSDRNLKSISNAQLHNQDRFIMVMIPEGMPVKEISSILRQVNVLENKSLLDVPREQAKSISESRGYFLITKAEVIDQIETLIPQKIRSFKEDLFPHKDIQPQPKQDKESWRR